MPTAIEWAANPDGTPGETWEVTSGCTPVSRGCHACWAKRLAEGRLKRLYPLGFGHVEIHPERLNEPLHWRKPRTVFVDSRSDLFHEDVDDQFISLTFAVMAMSPGHTFLLLTKRPGRMKDYLAEMSSDPDAYVYAWAREASNVFLDGEPAPPPVEGWPLPNVWLGVSVEDQATADERIPLLLETPAAHRFISVEPLLEELDLWDDCLAPNVVEHGVPPHNRPDWVIVGGESAPGLKPSRVPIARPCDPARLLSVVEQCRTAAVPCFVKQLGSYWAWWDGFKDKKGADPAEWPAELRVREAP